MSIKTPLFSLRHVTVRGNTNTNTADITAITAPFMGKNIFLVNIGKIQQQIQHLPYVQNAWVQKELPNSLQVDIQEYSPAAIIHYKGTNYIVNEKGLVLSKFDSGAEINLPLVNSDVTMNQVPVKEIKQIADFLNQKGPGWSVQSYHYLGDDQIILNFSNWQIITLTSNNFADNFFRIEQVYQTLTPTKCPLLDIRFDKTLCLQS